MSLVITVGTKKLKMSEPNQENQTPAEEQLESQENLQDSTKIVDDDVIDEASLQSEDGQRGGSDTSSISSVSVQKVVYQLVPIEYQGRSGDGITIQERTSFLVQELGLHQCAPSMASARINDYIATMISGSSWKAVQRYHKNLSNSFLLKSTLLKIFLPILA